MQSIRTQIVYIIHYTHNRENIEETPKQRHERERERERESEDDSHRPPPPFSVSARRTSCRSCRIAARVGARGSDAVSSIHRICVKHTHTHTRTQSTTTLCALLSAAFWCIHLTAIYENTLSEREQCVWPRERRCVPYARGVTVRTISSTVAFDVSLFRLATPACVCVCEHAHHSNIRR